MSVKVIRKKPDRSRNLRRISTIVWHALPLNGAILTGLTSPVLFYYRNVSHRLPQTGQFIGGILECHVCQPEYRTLMNAAAEPLARNAEPAVADITDVPDKTCSGNVI